MECCFIRVISTGVSKSASKPAKSTRSDTMKPTWGFASPEPTPRGWPWATGLILAVATIALGFSAIGQALIYDREHIMTGEIWRVWTGHAVHFNGSHFFWDMLIFVPAAGWLERLWTRRTRWFLFAGPPVLSLLLLLGEPGLPVYAGISGMASGTLVLLAGLQLGRPSEPAWFWWGVLLLVMAKFTFELIGHEALLANLPPGVQVVPLAHIGGLVCGFAWLMERKSPSRPSTT